MTTFSINLDPLPGETTEAVCRDAVRIATQMQVLVCFSFNGIRCIARPGDDWISMQKNLNSRLQEWPIQDVLCGAWESNP